MNNNHSSIGESLRVTFKYTAILLCFFMVLMMAWESQKTDAAVAEVAIPQESIRLRILANSDGTQDQMIKRQIRDKVVEQMNQWVTELEDPQSLEQARSLIRGHLPELNALVGTELASRGMDYSYNVELGVVPFPTKLYGGTVYPAGDYEAVRVTLGAGKGQNWWCVLFPPLCFIDAGSGDAAAPATAQGTKTVSASNEEGNGKTVQTVAAATSDSADGETPEVRFFVWELLQNLWNWISSLWA
ncbi:stage II sporulation protein R [Paenibacillus albidus]|uniref:Stage II sporulation protein R n=1 Tax=Paenibacillus albidus TaxID=2041023 RepID=A0A917FJZ5_9BACL|nr:stage II sporulation protein R [Paenibacillus albidus]GGF87200.1 stage II sporulation protein R [Paenibacillus albidus]